MQLDVRGPRFAAAVTTVVLIAIALTGSGWLAAAQAVVFAIGAASARHAPYGVLFRTVVAPRLGPPAALEPAEPVRFAQGVGFVFATAAALGYFAGVPALGLTATAFALVAAFLNAVFGLCLGCETYLLLRRTFGKRAAA
ncbi:MAG: DUF4395 domain-containing protein [Hamadaea sp.]|nr:DUF4395 domain-containing protein [Hamadaea sp.]